MSRYIDAEWLKIALELYRVVDLSEAPSIDIVRCGECKHSDGKPIADGRYWCNMYGGFMRYCSEGERSSE